MEDLEDDVEGNLFPHPPKGVGGEMRQETGEREKRYKGSIEKVQHLRGRNSRTKLRKRKGKN